MMNAPGTAAAELPILLEGVSVTLNDTAILRDVSLCLGTGGPTVLIGPNGSGKTTLLRVAMGLVRPSAGRVTWGARPYAPPTRRALVFQRPVMLRRSVAENIDYALAVAGVARRDRPRRTSELLALVGLGALGDRPAPRLSGGERQRLALARALARDPAVLFLDEPTASLDPAATQSIEALIREICRSGVKVVLSTHDLREAERLEGDIVLLHRGRIIESGSARNVLNQPQTEEAKRFIAGQLLV